MKSDVKPVICASNISTAVLFTGTSGTCIINGLANITTVSTSTNTQVYIPVSVGAGGTETLNLPEDGVLYAGRNGTGIIDGVGVASNTSALIVTLFIEK
jgi:hypothetical protein